MPVDEFTKSASRREVALRNGDPEHDRGRAVVCDPVGGFVSRLLGRDVRMSTYLSSSIDDGTIFRFSDAASALMADRAHRTTPIPSSAR